MATLAEQWEVEAPRKVSPATQAERDVTRRQIIEDELGAAKKRLAGGDARAQAEVDSLTLELGKLAPAKTAANESFASLWEATPEETPKAGEKPKSEETPPKGVASLVSKIGRAYV